MKVVVFFAFLFFAANPTVKPDRNGKQTNPGPDLKTEPTIAVVNNCSPAKDKAEAKTEAPERDASVRIDWEGLGTWALVFVGVATFIAIWKQVTETAKATDAMRRSVSIQEVSLKQWVEISDWQGGEDIWRPDDDARPHHLTFTFNIVNPTDYPVTLNRAEWRIAEQTSDISFDGVILPPKGAHPTLAWYDLTMEQVESYGDKSKILELDIGGIIYFTDVSQNAQSQPFWTRLDCAHEKGVLGTKPYKTSGWVVNEKAWKKQDGESQKAK